MLLRGRVAISGLILRSVRSCARVSKDGGESLLPILRDAAKTPLLRMRFWTLMVRSAATPRVSNHEAVNAAIEVRPN
jgi:hypothetical protein